MDSYYSESELLLLGFKSVGHDVKISRYANIYGKEQIVLGNHIRIDDFCVLSGRIIIGNNVHIAPFCGIFAGDAGVIFGDFSGLSSKCSIYAESDDYSGEYMTNPTVDDECRRVSRKTVTIGKHVIVGCGSSIMPGVAVGDGCAIGSMSLVNKSIDSWGIYAGIPVRRIKDRKEDLLKYENR